MVTQNLEQHRSPKRWWLWAAGLVLVLMLATAAFAAGIYADRLLNPAATVPTTEPAGVTDQFQVFWQAWNLAERYYVDKTALDPKRMTYGAISGMLDSLGDVGHTRFLTPEDLKAEQEALAGKLQGIGIEVTIRNGLPTVVAPIDGSPAAEAGLRPGDVIVKVNGELTSKMSLSQVVSKIRGPAGTQVTITIVHRGSTEMIDKTITRANIQVPNVTWAMLPGRSVAVVRISQFGEGEADELNNALNGARTAGAKGLVLDLRNSPGGYVDQAVRSASQFMNSGVVYIERDRDGNQKPVSVRGRGIATDMPMVTLVNEGTASASEILAGALQDNGRSKIVGQRTFGTGTVLSLFQLKDGSAIYLGTSEWLTPKGKAIRNNGIEPDIEEPMASDASPLVPGAIKRMNWQQIQQSGDAQLLKALELLTETNP
jgi:carboxyl-terminal processing protease